MVFEMQAATERAIAKIMAKHGNNSHKNISRTMEVY